jgi:hypothetical protein
MPTIVFLREGFFSTDSERLTLGSVTCTNVQIPNERGKCGQNPPEMGVPDLEQSDLAPRENRTADF